VRGQLHASVAILPRKELSLPIGQEAGWAPELVWTMCRAEHSFSFRDSNSSPSVKPIASHYTIFSSVTFNKSMDGVTNFLTCIAFDIEEQIHFISEMHVHLRGVFTAVAGIVHGVHSCVLLAIFLSS
jgi:hypothetical protein